MSSNDDTSTPNFRTPIGVVIRTITTHCFALGSYAYTSTLLKRPVPSHIQALRLLFFFFVPTLPLVEILQNALRSLFYYFGNFEEDDAINLRYYVSAALGMHAARIQDDDNKVDANDRRNNVHLLTAGSQFAEKTVVPVSWVWIGKLLGALFSCTQAAGTIVMWIRRMNSREGDALTFDHRNGAMGIASAICAVISILVLIIRLNWKVAKAFEGPQSQAQAQEKDRAALTQFGIDALLSMALFLGIASAADRDNRWMYTSIGCFAFIFTADGRLLTQGWQSLMLFIFIYVFREEISRRLGLQERLRKWFPGRRLYRMKALVALLMGLWIIADILRALIIDIIQVVKESKGGFYENAYPGFWWQDPLSESLLVI